VKPYPKKKPCPCDSGKKYGDCCSLKGIQFGIKRGEIYERRELPPEVGSLLDQMNEMFKAKFGREPGPDDPLFWDPDADTPQPLLTPENESDFTKMMTDAMLQAGVSDAFVYAYRKTGLLVTAANKHSIPDRDLEEWGAAVQEFEEMFPDGGGNPLQRSSQLRDPVGRPARKPPRS
jgi:hypothetical protein